MDVIEQYYVKYNFPSSDKLHTILKKDNYNIPYKMIQDFLDDQKEYQLLKPKLRQRKKEGYHVAFAPMESVQMDIYDLSKYSTFNRKYKYIFAMIDVFTRKSFCVPMKSKTSSEVIEALKSILDENVKPNIITCDSDKAFLSKKITTLLESHNIILNNVIAFNDHLALSLIDRFALTLKTILSKLFIRNKSANWITHLERVIDVYNNTPHSALNELTPNEANDKINESIIISINQDKIRNQLNKKSKPEFKLGDYARISLARTFRKGTEPKYSDKAYEVIDVSGHRITLSNNKVYLTSKLLKVKTPPTTTTPNIIEKINLSNKLQRRIKKEGIEETNIIRPTRSSSIRNSSKPNLKS
jgi:hypothetical protein